MKQSLKPLLDIRVFRERKVLKQLKICRRHLETCKQKVLESKNCLAVFRQQKPAQEAQLLADLQSEPVCPQRLNDYMETLRGLEQKDLKLAKEVKNAEAACKQAVQALVDARRALQVATRGKEKMENLVQDQLREARFAEERKDDLEIEEISHCFGKQG